MTIITITQALYGSLKRTLEFVEQFPADCQITIILGIQTLESFFNELTVLERVMDPSDITPEITSLCDLLSEIEKSKGSLKLKVLNTDFILNGKNKIKGDVLYEDLNLLLSLRNQLVHPKPIILSEEKSITQDKLFKAFVNKKLVDQSAVNKQSEKPLNHYLLNEKVALWCVQTVKNIINYFIDSFSNNSAKIALGIVKLSTLEPNEFKDFISEIDKDLKNN